MSIRSNARNVEAAKPHWLEWATGIVSTLAVAGIVVWLATEAVFQQETPPDFRSSILDVERTKTGFRVEFELFNDGSTTAAAVEVRGEIVQGDHVAETAEATFDYVAAHSSAKGAVLFTTDPASGQIRLRAVGYAEP